MLWTKVIAYIIKSYTIFMISMRVGTQGIPIYFKGKADDAFKEKIIINGITFVSKLFNGKYELIFTADRWFNSVKIMKHIDSLGHTYTIRLKGNVTVYENGNKTIAKKLKKR